MVWYKQFETGVETIEDKALLDELDRDSKVVTDEEEFSTTAKIIEPIQFQPVKAPGHYEAETAVRGQDVIFHIWPWGYHQAVAEEARPPSFRPKFQDWISTAFLSEYPDANIFIDYDADMGSFFVKIHGVGVSQFWMKRAIQCLENLYNLLAN